MLRRTSKFALQYNLALKQIFIRFHCMVLDLITSSANQRLWQIRIVRLLHCNAFFSSTHVTPYFMELRIFYAQCFQQLSSCSLAFHRLFFFKHENVRVLELAFSKYRCICCLLYLNIRNVSYYYVRLSPTVGHGQALVEAIRIYENIRII